MKCVLVFDHLNDIIFTKYNKKFASHINEFAKVQGLMPLDEVRFVYIDAVVTSNCEFLGMFSIQNKCQCARADFFANRHISADNELSIWEFVYIHQLPCRFKHHFRRGYT